MASTADILKGAASSLTSGKELDSNNLVGSESGHESPAQDSYESSVSSSESTLDDFSKESEDTPPDSQEADKKLATSKSEQTPKTSGEKEVITITDEKGRRKVEVDYTDRGRIKKAFEMEAAARKWQADRDRAIKSQKALEAEAAKVKSDFAILDEAFKRGGAEEVVDLLSGRKGAFAEQVRKQLERAKFLERASPEEVEALTAREMAEKQSRENEQLRKDNEEFKKQMLSTQEATELRAVESRVNPAFDKYRFADKLGDADDEHMFDEMLWTTALKRLEPYEEKGLEITSELAEREFASVARSIRKRIGAQAEKKAGRAIDQKKQEATENVQASLKSGYSSQNSKAQDYLNRGDTSGLIKNWGSLFSKKKQTPVTKD